VGEAENPWLVAAQRAAAAGPTEGGTGASLAVRPTLLPDHGASAGPERPYGRDDFLPARIPHWSGPPQPHLGEFGDTVGAARHWWLGVHGGAGVSTLVRLIPGGADAYRWWPAPGVHGGPSGVVLVCRTHARGMEAARKALLQWDQGQVPTGLTLLGLVAVADAPGRLPAAQAEALRMLNGAVDRMWTVPWVEDLRRVADLRDFPLPPGLTRLAAAVDALSPPPVPLW
jgi:hypothetical protein